MNNKDTLEVKNLSAQYGLVPAIDNISLSVKKEA